MPLSAVDGISGSSPEVNPAVDSVAGTSAEANPAVDDASGSSPEENPAVDDFNHISLIADTEDLSPPDVR